MKIFPLILLLVLFNGISSSQNMQKEFVEALINGSDNLEKYIDENELANSKRLGINYDGIKYKFIISFDIDEKIKDEVNKNNLKYEIKESDLGNGYSKAEFTVPSLNYSKQFYFRNGKWISPISYFSKDWTTKTSKYFIFKISEPKYFNDYCINKLDEFVDSIAVLLDFNTQQTQLLEKEKIYYVLCKDEKEIEQITGFNIRGQFITAMDGIITTYNTHYHELAHLLINYKLKNLSLYTLPFFMEGFAVAVGGRGGMAKKVVLDIGYFLQKSGFLTYDSIITNDGFYREDASLTYPVAGLYNAFLIDFLGMKEYLKIYKQVNGNIEDIRKVEFEGDFLTGETFHFYIEHYKNYSIIGADSAFNFDECMPYANLGAICDSGLSYKIIYSKKTEAMLIGDMKKIDWTKSTKYISKICLQFYNDTSMDFNHQYLIHCKNGNVSIYNTFTNELIYSYDTSFLINPKTIYLKDNYFYFYLKKDVFDKDFEANTCCCGRI